MVFRLLKRADAAVAGPSFEAGWAGRLHGIGRALDEYETVLRDLAIASAGHDIWVSAFEYRPGMYRSTWAPVTFRVENYGNEYTVIGAASQRPRAAGWSALNPSELWIMRFRALGVMLDQSSPPPRDAVILDVGGGFVVQGLIPSKRDQHDHWETVTREIDAETIAATIRLLSPVGKVRVMRLRTLDIA